MANFLNEYESNKLLADSGINMVKSYRCKGIDEVVERGNKLGFPIVMKILSQDIQHKTDAGCVFLNIENEKELKESYKKTIENAKKYNKNVKIDGVLIQKMEESGLELIIGINEDPQFGKMILLGMGGIYVEVFKDFSMRLIPIDKIEAYKMIEETKVNEIIEGKRGKKYDKKLLVDTLLKLSDLAKSNEEIKEIDINPFFLYYENEGGIGIDALIKMD